MPQFWPGDVVDAIEQAWIGHGPIVAAASDTACRGNRDPRFMMGLMSELDVIIIHIRAEQAAEYERLFAEHELPRWREYKARGAFLSARISRVAFGTDDRKDVVKYAIAVEVPDHAAHSEHDADPGFQEFNRLADMLQPEGPLVYGGELLHAV